MSDDTMTSDNTESGNLTVEQASQAIEGMLTPTEDSTEQPEVVEEQTEVIEETEETEAEAEEVEEDAEAEEETEEVVDDLEEETEEEQTFTVKASGEEKEVTLDELKKSYQLGTDYTKKTQEIAEQRKLIEQNAKAIIEARQVRDDYSQKLKVLEVQLSTGLQDLSPEELEALKENDPVSYSTKVSDMMLNKNKLQKIQAEQQRIAQEQQSDRMAQTQQYVAEELKKLEVALPEFSSKAKGEQIKKDIRVYGKKIGFNDAELSAIIDSRHVLVMHDASQYDKLKSGKAGVKKKLKEAPKMVKSGAKVKQTNSDVKKRQKNRLLQTGSARDAGAILENFL